jgi:hypothetical protein
MEEIHGAAGCRGVGLHRNTTRQSGPGVECGCLREQYDKVPEAINVRALATKYLLKILESKDAMIWRLFTQVF